MRKILSTLCLMAPAFLLFVMPADAQRFQSAGSTTARTLADYNKPWLRQLKPQQPRTRTFVVTPSGRTVSSSQVRQPQYRPRPRTRVQQAAIERPSKPKAQLPAQFLPQVVSYNTKHAPGTIIVDTNTRHLYLVMEGGKAKRYGVGVGKPGFEWAGTHRVTRKAEWPDWRPPASMIAREKKKGRHLPTFVAGGPNNPLGARSLYLGSTLYRIHGSNEPWSIGQAVSSGCIRMRNEDVIDLYSRVKVGTKVIVI
jgi:lipoprotein-anchoring transpeptidase ErfK/SrfK